MGAAKDIEKANRIYAEAKLNGDVDTLINGFTEDAILLVPGHPPLSGKDEIRGYYVENYSQSVHETLELLHVKKMGNLAVVCGQWEESGETGKYLEVQERDPHGKWRIKRLCIQFD